MWALSSFRRRKEGKTKTGLHAEFSLGGGGMTLGLYTICLILKVIS
jgi:hypothetical protein